MGSTAVDVGVEAVDPAQMLVVLAQHFFDPLQLVCELFRRLLAVVLARERLDKLRDVQRSEHVLLAPYSPIDQFKRSLLAPSACEKTERVLLDTALQTSPHPHGDTALRTCVLHRVDCIL